MSSETEYAYDVFISYSHEDEEWVTKTLLPRLEQAGLKVCIDYRDFVPGRPALINMQDAVQDSRHTLLVMTPAWVASQWTLYETLLTRTDDPAGLRRRTVPLRLQSCDVPVFISMLTYVDFTRSEPDRQAIAWTQLHNALGAPEPAEAVPAVIVAEAATPVAGATPGPLAQAVRWIQGHRVWTALALVVLLAVPTLWGTRQILPALWGVRQVAPGDAGATWSAMDGEWNVAVARFSGVGTESIQPQDADRLSMVFYNRLVPEMDELGSEADIVIRVWSPEQTGEVAGDTPEERAASAEALARAIGAQVVIYGTVRQTGGRLELQPEFYVNVEDNYQLQELAGQHALGAGIQFAGGSQNVASQITLNRELARRAQALALITRGITYYSLYAYEDALSLFEQANQDDYWQQSDRGREVVYQFQGNAAGGVFLLDQAEQAYRAALEIEPEYARAYAGLGGLYYVRALQGAGDDGDTLQPDVELLNRAVESFEKALHAKVQPLTADIPAKVAFGLGQVYAAQWFAGQTLAGQDTQVLAVEQFQAVIEAYGDGKNPRLQEFAAEAHARLGLIEQQLGNVDGAIQGYLTARELAENPARRGWFSALLADLYEGLGQAAEAEAANRRAVDEYTAALAITYRDELKAEYWAEVATRHQRLGDVDEAIQALEQAVDLCPEDSQKRALLQSWLQELEAQ